MQTRPTRRQFLATCASASGNSGPIDLPRMMTIVVDAGYHGYCGIEHGPAGRELDGIRELRQQLEATRDQLQTARRRSA